MSDSRYEKLSITLTRQEWDGVCGGEHATYAYDFRYPAYEKIKAKNPGVEARRAAARAEFEAALPKLDRSAKYRIRREVRKLLKLHREGTLDVDHLGSGPDHDRSLWKEIGFDVGFIPHTANGHPALHFAIDSPHFERNPADLLPKDRQWFIDMLGRQPYVTVHRTWNDRGPWVSAEIRTEFP